MSLGEKIRKLRLSKDITQKELADKLNVSFQTISKWENNINEPDLTSVKKLANIFGCPVDFFFEDDESKVNESLNNLENKEKEIEVKEEKEITKPKKKEYVFLKSDEDLDSNGNVIKVENKKEEKEEFKVREVEDYSSPYLYQNNGNEDKEEKITLIQKEENKPLLKVGYCDICLKPVFNDSSYYESKSLNKDHKEEVKVYCFDCYNKKKLRSAKKVGSCKKCSTNLYDNDEYFKVNIKNEEGKEEETLLCKDCYAKYLKENENNDKLNQTSSARAKSKVNNNVISNKQTNKQRNISKREDKVIIIWSLILGFIALASTLGVCIYKYDVVTLKWTIILPILFGYMVLSTIYCLFSDTYISELFLEISSKVIHFPGLIFEFSADGFAWLIGMKILFAIIGFLGGLAFILFATFIAISLSFFSYLPLLAYNKTHYSNLKD